MDLTVDPPAKTQSNGSHSSADHTVDLKLAAEDPVAPPPSDQQSTVQMSGDPIRQATAVTAPTEPSITAEPSKSTMETVRGVLWRWGKNVKEAAKLTEDLSRNTWQHLNTGPSIVEATMGRIAQGTKVIAEGGYDRIFRQTFEISPDEQLITSYACYLSTSAGPVMGVLYLSNAKLAYCSDSPLSYKVGGKTEWSYYKVVIPLDQLRAVNPSTSKVNPAEKYIQIISIDEHEFWFMGFLYYESAVKCLQDALDTARNSRP